MVLAIWRCLKRFYSDFSPGDHFVQWSRTTFERGHFEEHLCESILNFGSVVQEKIMFKDIFISTSGCHFLQGSGSVCAILVEGIISNISVT